jgi:hypothetical protein
VASRKPLWSFCRSTRVPISESDYKAPRWPEPLEIVDCLLEILPFSMLVGTRRLGAVTGCLDRHARPKDCVHNHAAERAHLTTAAAGQIGRKAGVRRIELSHFSPRYAGEEERVLDEVMAAFADRSCEGIRS